MHATHNGGMHSIQSGGKQSTLCNACPAPFSGAFVIAVVEDGVLAARLLYLRIERYDQVRHTELPDVGHLHNRRQLQLL